MATKKFNVTVNGTTYEVEVEEVKSAGGAPKAAAPAPVAKATAGAGEHSVDAPMPGKIIKLVAAEGQAVPMPGKIIKLVANEGQAVKAGDVLLILEAMKMQNEITADADGTVKKFNVAAGQSVKAHESLVILG